MFDEGGDWSCLLAGAEDGSPGFPGEDAVCALTLHRLSLGGERAAAVCHTAVEWQGARYFATSKNLLANRCTDPPPADDFGQ